jgi:thiol-disulfide isomerase/thioredoxin
MGRQTNTSRRRAQGNAREKAAAARQAQARLQRRRRFIVLTGTTVGVLAVLGAIVAVGVTSSGNKTKVDTSRPAADPAVVTQVAAVSSATLDAIGPGKLISKPKAINDPPLTANGHPEVLYIGAEYCPYCAAERWALVQALSRFGTFSGLKSMHSAPDDVFANTPTFSFYQSTYTSDAVSFTPRELETVTHAPLEKATAAEEAIWHKYTGQGSFPFIDVGGKYVLTSPSYDQTVMKGMTAEQIAAQLNDPNSAVAKGIDGAANVLTAAICKATNNAPTDVCTSAGVAAAATVLGG